MDYLLEHVSHRPWPLPHKSWRWKQKWKDLLFVHWEVDKDWLRSKIPPKLELDLFNDKAWIGIVPFSMYGVTLKGFPAPKFMCNFPEINIRTYVRHRDKSGIWFFSLDVPNPIAVWAARTFFYLPYYLAKMQATDNSENIHYFHQRNDKVFNAYYKSDRHLNVAADSFEHWATERYCLYTTTAKGDLIIGQIHHQKWPLREAKLEILQNTLLDRIPVGGMHSSILFSKSIDVIIFPIEKVE
ncbi:MAG: DUF2071 domain-containing protein [Verrucomicrobiota bacterium]